MNTNQEKNYRFAAIFALILLIANASAVTLVPEKTSISSCICETNLVKIMASNPTDSFESVIMTPSGDKAWVIPGPKEFNLPPKSSKEITAFVTPDCFAIPGKYQVAVAAKSSLGSSQTQIGVDVSACVLLPKEQTISVCRGEVATARMPIKNIARDEERIYVLSATSSDSNIKSITVQPKITVDIDSEKLFDVSIDSTNLQVGMHNYQIKAQALYEATNVPTTDFDTSNLLVEVKNCESYDYQVPQSVDVCAGIPTVFKAKLANKGAPAEIKLTSDSNYVTLKPTSGTLHVGETADIELTINAQKGTSTAKLTAKSELKTVEKEMKINSRDCYGVEMQLTSEKVICSEYGAELDLSLKNREIASEYALSVSGIEAKLGSEKISLGKMESGMVKFTIPKDSPSGTYSATITAQSKDAKDSITKDFSIQKCFDFRLTGPSIEMCPCEEATFDYELINFGIKDDAYSLESGSGYLKLKESQAVIKSKEKTKLTATINSCSLDSGKYNAIISAKSSGFASQDSLKIDLTVKSKEACYGIEIRPVSDMIKSKCEIKSLSTQVTNKGTKETAVSLSATAASKMTPDNLLLKPGETKEVFLVIFPSPSRCGTQFNVDIKAESKGITITKTVKVDMEPEEKGSVSPKPTATPTTISEVKNLEADITYANDTLNIKSVPGAKVLIAGEEGKTVEEKTDESGNLATKLGAGTFLITLSREGYKPVTLQVNVTGNQTGIGGGAAGNLGTIPLLLIAFLIIIAALYFVLRKSDGDEEEEDSEDEEDEEEIEEEEEKKSPKPRRKRK